MRVGTGIFSVMNSKTLQQCAFTVHGLRLRLCSFFWSLKLTEGKYIAKQVAQRRLTERASRNGYNKLYLSASLISNSQMDVNSLMLPFSY